MPDILPLIMRWTHILSMSFLIGTALYARFVLLPTVALIAPSERVKLTDGLSMFFRPLVVFAIIGLFGSGMYNLVNKVNPPHGYHMWFGIKFLLALHVAAVSLLMGRPGVELAKRQRWMTGVVGSGIVVLAISAFLRALK